MANLRIKELMEESRRVGRRVTQADLAKDAGVAQQTIARLANNQRKRLNPVILQSLADTFTKALNRKITISDLILSDDETETPEHNQPTDELPPEPRTIDDKIDDINEQLEGIRNEIADLHKDMSKEIAEVKGAISK